MKKIGQVLKRRKIQLVKMEKELLWRGKVSPFLSLIDDSKSDFYVVKLIMISCLARR